MGVLKDSKQPEETPPEPDPEEVAPEDPGEDLTDRHDHFLELGFTDVEAWALAHTKASWSECRERFIKRGATHAEAARYFLNET